MPKEKAAKAERKKLWGSVFFVALNIAIVAYLACREFGSGTGGALRLSQLHIRPAFLLLALACFGAAVLTETLKYRAMMFAAEGRRDPRGAFECAVLGKYYDNITPLGAGGQPFQILYLKKRGLSTGASAALPIAGFLFLQFAFVLIAVFVFTFNSGVVQGLPAIRVSAWIGLAFYLFVPVCIVAFSLTPRAFASFVRGVVGLLGKLRVVKNGDAALEKIFGSLREYAASLALMRRSRGLYGKLMTLSLIYQLAVMSVPYFVLRAFGSENGWPTVFSLVVFIYAAITIIPTPGNSGAAEGSFYAVFASLAQGYLFWAMLVWRLLVYYAWLLSGLLVLSFGAAAPKKARPKRPVPEGPLRVMLFTDLFYPSIDGVVRTVDAYAARLSRDGGHCCVVCPRPAAPFRDDFPYEVVRTQAIRLPGLSYLLPAPGLTRGLGRRLADWRPDVIHAHSPFLEGHCALKLGKKLGVPVVATFHSKFYDDVFDITHSRFLARLTVKYVAAFFRRADEVWACSEGAARTLRGYGYAGALRVMENGVEIPALPDRAVLQARAKSEFSLPDDRHLLLFVGQQIWHKNLRLVLDTARALRDGDGYLTLLVGEGYDGAAIRAYAQELGLDDAVRFTGQIADRELLYGLYAACGLFFFPSDYDTSGLVIREAALMAAPSLLHAGSDAADAVTDGVNGYTAASDASAMAAKIRAIFADEAARVRVGEAARQTIPVSWDEVVRRAVARYRALPREAEGGPAVPEGAV